MPRALSPSANVTHAIAIWRWMSTCSAQYASCIVFSASRSAASRSMSAAAAFGLPDRAAPSARAKCVMASVCGNVVWRGVNAAASAHAPRSSAYRAGIAAAAYTPATPGAAAPVALTIQPRSGCARLVGNAPRLGILRDLQVRVRLIVHRVQLFGSRVLLARGLCRSAIGLDRFLPQAHARERVRRHVQRVRHRRRERRVAARRAQRLLGERRVIVGVNDVVREPGMLRMLLEERLEDRRGLQLL